MNFIGRLTLTGRIDVLTGLHIGAGGAGGIGLVDNPVIRDPLTRQPMVPGSSLKGRLRHALETLLSNGKHPEVIRLFGGAPEDQDTGLTRLYVRDSMLTADSAKLLEATETEGLYVEVKTENIIDRVTGAAQNPRQSERLPAGSKLTMELVYNCYELDQASDDLLNLKAAIDFVEDEYLGGSGSRGYGRVSLPITELTWKTLEDYKTSKEAKSVTTNAGNWLSEAYKLCSIKAIAR